MVKQLDMDIIKHSQGDYISAKEIYEALGIKRKFAQWIKYSIERADLQEDKDFVTILLQSTGGRPTTDYLLTKDSCITVIVMSGGEKAKELRKQVIDIYKQRETLGLVTPREAAFAVKVVNALKYIENQKQAYQLHQSSFVERNGLSNYVYADFAKYRASIVGWDKASIDKALEQYLYDHAGFNRNKMRKKSMTEKMSVIDTPEAIRIAVLDILHAQGDSDQLYAKFSNLVKEMAKELNIEPLSKNETNLFQYQENISLQEISNDLMIKE